MIRLLKSKNVALPIFFLVVAAGWLGRDLFPAEGWALGGADMNGLFYPWWEFVRNSLFKSQIPFWDPRQFAGSPFLHNPQIAFFYPPSWLVFGLPVNVGVSFYYLFHLTAAGWGMARLVEQVGHKDESSQLVIFGSTLGPVMAGLAFMLSGFFATRIFAGHAGFLATHVWLPWLLVMTSKGLAAKNIRYAAPTALFLALAILAGHTTTLLYIGIIWGLYAVWQTSVDPGRHIKFSALFVSGSAFLAVWLASVQLFPTVQLIQRSGRLSQGGYDFATRFSLPWSQLITLLIPEWFGEPTHIGYWGAENFEELTAYPAIFATVAFIASLVVLLRSRGQKSILFFTLLSIFGLLIAVGSNGFLYRWLYLIIPPFRVMRAPGRALFFFAFSTPVLMGLLIERLFKEPFWGRQGLAKSIVVSACVWVGSLILLFGIWWFAKTPEALGRGWHQLGNVAVTGAVLLAGLLLLRWLVANVHRPHLMRLGSIGLLLLLGTDLAFFGQKLIRAESMTPAPLWVEAASVPGLSQGRILPWGINIFEQNGAGQVGLRSIFGYNTLENGAITALAASVPDPRSKAYDVLGVTHVVSESGLEQFSNDDFGMGRGLVLVEQINTTRVYARPTTLPYARLVSQYEVIADAKQQLKRLHAADFDPASVVLLEAEPACADSSFNKEQQEPVGTIVIVEQRGGYFAAEVTNAEPVLLIVSETFFPGWQALVDGDHRPVEQAYTALQAVCIPAGEHLIELRFRPVVFIWAGVFSLVGLLVACLLWQGRGIKKASDYYLK
ncbi:MAG: hypothetical protein ACI9EW_000456 [Cellvibrionaceae bacterium]|jgi:hypothetical protein